MSSQKTALVIPTVGAATLEECLASVARLRPRPPRTVIVHSGPRAPGADTSPWELIHRRRRLGFAASVNLGVDLIAGDCGRVAVVNDDAILAPNWLEVLSSELDTDARLGALQGTVTDAAGLRVDGRGIDFDRWGLPIQIDHAARADDEPEASRAIVATSGTAALYRLPALLEVRLASGQIFDPAFGCYHEDLDLGLRLRRLGWLARWVPGAPCRHLGSISGAAMVWRHPWWLLANRWRALAGNLHWRALLVSMPRLLRGEARAVSTLSRRNPRALVIAVAVTLLVPFLLLSGLRRRTPGPRLDSFKGAHSCG